MCQLSTCYTCTKLTFVGCGKHLATIFAGKKKEELCSCPYSKVSEYKATMK